MLTMNSDKPQSPCVLEFDFNTKLEQRTEKYTVKCTVLKSVNTNHISEMLFIFFTLQYLYSSFYQLQFTVSFYRHIRYL